MRSRLAGTDDPSRFPSFVYFRPSVDNEERYCFDFADRLSTIPVRVLVLPRQGERVIEHERGRFKIDA